MSRLDELRHEAEWRRCARDFTYFANTYAYIKHPARGRILFELRPAQIETVAAIEANRNVIILKARQVGYSTLFAVYQLWLAKFRDDQYIVDLSIGEREAVKLLAKSKYAYKFLPQWMRDRNPMVGIDNQQRMVFANESVIESLPSKKDPARGESVTLVLVDEWASFENPEEAWSAIEPIADVGGKIVGLSTAKGWGNFFHEMWQRARNGTAAFHPLFYSWASNTDRDQAWYDDKAANNPEWFMAQEYPRNEDEAFLKSGHAVFDLDMLSKLPVQKPLVGTMHKSPGNLGFTEARNGPLKVWEHPDSMDAYVIGADVAEGLEWGDFSSAHVVSCRTGLTVAHYHAHVEADVFGERLYELGQWYGGALMGVEVNNHGLSTLHALRRLQYPRIYFRNTLNQKTNRQTNEMGWRTTKATKGLLVDELGMAVRTGELIVWDEHTIAEMKQYVRDEKGGMAGSPFDDRVISLGIANMMRRYAQAPDHHQYIDEYLSGGWWAKQLPSSVRAASKGVIGSNAVRAHA